MDDYEYLTILYDYYGELFSEVQRNYFEWYYFDNLSLAEIAQNVDKSRNAIHKIIKNVDSRLYEYEEKLKLYEKSIKIKEILNSIDNEEVKNKIEELLWREDYQFI